MLRLGCAALTYFEFFNKSTANSVFSLGELKGSNIWLALFSNSPSRNEFGCNSTAAFACCHPNQSNTAIPCGAALRVRCRCAPKCTQKLFDIDCVHQFYPVCSSALNAAIDKSRFWLKRVLTTVYEIRSGAIFINI